MLKTPLRKAILTNRQTPVRKCGENMDTAAILRILTSAGNAIPAHRAEGEVPGGAGLYAIFVDRYDSLPEPFRARLAAERRTLIYVGCSDVNLGERLTKQEFQHKRAATFFRSIGAVLGYWPPRGSLKSKVNQKNYRFSADDTKQITQWIYEHLSVRYLEVDAASLPRLEKMVIGELRPILNVVHNPDAMPELRALRAKCRKIALT